MKFRVLLLFLLVLLVAQNVSAVDYTTNLVHRYTYDTIDTTGMVVADTGTGIDDLTLHNGSSQFWVTQEEGCLWEQCYNVSPTSTSNRGSSNTGVSFLNADNSWTMSIWVKDFNTSAVGSQATIIGEYTGADKGCRIEVCSGGALCFATNDFDDAGSKFEDGEAGISLNDGFWHQITGVRVDATNYNFYVDGVLVGNNTGGCDAGGIFRAGGARTDTDYMPGVMVDEARYYSDALTSAQINITYEHGLEQIIIPPFNGSAIITGFETQINNYLSTCTADAQGFCDIPFIFNAKSTGNLSVNLSSLNYAIKYNLTYNNETIEKALNTYVLEVFSNETVFSSLFIGQTESNPIKSTTTSQSTFTVQTRGDWVDDDPSILNETLPFYWKLNFTGNLYNTTEKNQTSYKIYINNCTSGIRALNITIQDEDTDALLVSDLSSFFSVWYDSSSWARNHSFALTGSNNYSFCIYPTWVNYSTDAQMEYSSPGYDTKSYYLNSYGLSNITKLLPLYLTNESTQVTLTVKDFSDTIIQGATVKVLSYDIGTNSFTTTEIVETDDSGEAFVQLILNTAWYSFIVEIDGEVKLQTLPTKITSASKTLKVDLDSVDYFEKSDTIAGISHDIDFVNSTKTFSFTYSDPTGDIAQGCLKVVRTSINSETTLTDTCLTSTAASIEYVIIEQTADYGYTATGYIKFDDGSIVPLEVLSISFDERFETFGLSGIFISFLVVLSLVMVGIWSPVIAIVLMIVGLITVIALGLFGLTVPLIIGFMIMGVTVMYKISK